MLNQKYDSNKLSKQFEDVINKYTSENKQLLEQVEDLKATLFLNHNLLYNFLTNSSENKKEINDIIEKGKLIWEENEKLMELKKDLQIKTYKLKEFTENIPIEINNEISDIVKKNTNIKNELMKNEKEIKKLKSDLERVRNNALFKEARTEVYIAEPSKINIEKNDELIDVKPILLTAMKKHSKEKKKANKLEKEVKKAKEDLKSLKKDLNFKNTDDLLSKIKGYNIEIEKSEEEYEEEEEEEEKDDDDSSDGEKKNQKKKEKELEQLKENYQKLKNDYEEYQKRINKLKEEYKILKGKTDNVKNSMKK
jgi:DNA repair exonuclease SbcCD ATPase subunit